MLILVRNALAALAILGAPAFAETPAAPQSTPSATSTRLSLPQYVAPPIQQLQATQVREYKAPEARQGAAVDNAHVYAIVNSVIGKYDKATGERVARWSSPRGGLIRHINSCMADGGKLWCANSNFPETPMASSIEVFDTATLTHAQSIPLGILDEGSLTFFDRLSEGWIAGFAHYDGEGGLAYKNAAFAGVVLYDAMWRRIGGYMLPATVRERMAPHAASGGALGPDGLLYLLGHDRTEMYVMAKPVMGPVLLHVATIEIAAEGQAFSFDRTPGAGRMVYAISRPNGVVRSFRLPEVSLAEHPDARRFK